MSASLAGPVAGIVATFAILLAAGFHATPYNNYVLLADAFRHGRTWIDWPGPYIDALSYAGRYYVIEAPLPAVLLLPAVLAFGKAADQSLLAALLGGVALYAAWEICRRLRVPLPSAALLCGFLLLGTDLFWCAMLGDVWFIAHVSSVAFTLLALLELLGRRRGWLVAILGACAVESRFALLLALPVYAVLLGLPRGLPGDERSPDERRRAVLAFALALVPFAIGWVWYNELRWGVPYDIGYAAWYHQDQVGEPTGSPFRLSYVPYELYSFFVRFPDVRGTFPFLIPTLNGVALSWTSPALLLAFLARRPRPLVVAMWSAAVLTAIPSFLYYVNGFAQFGMRHALDFEPFLFVLMALAARRGLHAIGTALCLFSMLAGAWGIWYWRAFIRTG
ncbi:MAG: hypothetical protein WAJ85_11665 [Candidatus Baltobacteraceae bacterium]|jgi:hypothetical protein